MSTQEPITTKPRPRKWRRRLFWFVLVPCCFIAVGSVSGYYFIRYQAERRRDAAIAEARALGEPIWFVDVKPDPLPPDQDGTSFLLRAFDLHDQVLATGNVHPYFAETRSAYSRDKIQAESLFDPEMPAEELAALQVQVTAEAKILNLVKQALAKGRVQIPRDYDGAEALIFGDEHSIKLKGIAEAILAQIALNVRAGEAQLVVDQIHVLLQLSHILREEPTVLPQLSRFAVSSLALTGLTQALPRLELTDDQLALVDTDLAMLQAGVSMREALLAERAGIMTLSEHAAEDTEDNRTSFWLYRNFRALPLEDQAALMEVMRFEADIADDNALGLSEQSDALQMQFHEAGIITWHVRYPFTNLMTPGLAMLRAAGLNCRQRLSHARLALRLDRYKRRTGTLPETLEPLLAELPSAELAEIPLAIRSHLPPVYRLTDFGFQLYDMGENQTDEDTPGKGPLRGGGFGQDSDYDETGTLLEVRYKDAQDKPAEQN